MSRLRVKRTGQPQALVGLALGAFPQPAFVFVGNRANHDLVSGRGGVPAASDGSVATPKGIAYRTSRSNTTGLSFGTYSPAKSDTWTVLLLSNPAADGNIQTLYNQRGAGVGSAGFLIGANISSGFGLRNGGFGISCQQNDFGGSVYGVQSNSVSLVDGKFHVVAARRAGASVLPELFLDGALIAVTGTGTPASSIDTTQETKVGGVGNYTADSTYASNCDYPILAVWDGFALTDAQIRAISENPWQLFAPEPRRLRTMPAAGGTVLLDATPAATAAATAALSLGNPLASSASAAATSTAALSLTKPLTAAASAAATTTAALTDTKPLAAAAAANATATASLTPGVLMAAAAAVAATASAALTDNKPLAAAAAALAASTTSLYLSLPLAAAGAALAASTTSLYLSLPLAAAGAATAASTTSLYLSLPLAAAAAALAASTAAQAQSTPLAATATSVATTTAALSGTSLPTVGRPTSDTTTGAWAPSIGTTLYGTINEVAPDASNYISTTSLSTCEFALNNTAFPGTANQTLSYRASSSTGNGLTAVLKQGATTIATWSHALTNTDTLYTQTLTAGQIAAIVAGPLSVSLTST